MKTRKGNAGWIAAAAAAIALGSASAARADDEVVAKVPFSFIVGNVRMPAGKYVVKSQGDTPDVVAIAAVDGRQSAFVLTIPTNDAGGHPQLVFKRIGNQYVLAR